SLGKLAVNHRHQSLQVALEHIVLCAGPHRLYCALFAEHAGDEDERCVDITRANDVERLQAIEPWHREVGDDQVPTLLERGLEVFPGGDTLVVDLETSAVDTTKYQLGVPFGVLDQQEFEGGQRHHPLRSGGSKPR